MKNLHLLLANLAPDWVVASFPIIRIILVAVIAICAVVMIITTLMQSNKNEDGDNALSGAVQESYYAKNKGESKDVRLSRTTVVMASLMFACTILYFISLIIYQG